jgi:hypothetical protein
MHDLHADVLPLTDVGANGSRRAQLGARCSRLADLSDQLCQNCYSSEQRQVLRVTKCLVVGLPCA